MPQNPAAVFEGLVPLTEALIDRLDKAEEDNAHTAVTVLLMQALLSLGQDSVAMKQFFPVFDAIKGRIDASDLQGALKQTRLFMVQLKEIIDIVRAGQAAVTATAEPIDLSFRPPSYFWPLGLEAQLLTHIKGASRRAAVQRLIDSGQTDQIPALLAKAELSEEERTSLGRIHPMFMGGEYLPNQENDEVEIARIEINSTTFDVTSVYARRGTSAIHYRVVDEYNGDTLTGPVNRESAKPLTLGELRDFFLGAWSLIDVLEANYEGDVERMLGFFRASSEFYPDLDRLLRQGVVESQTADGEDDEESDDAESRF